MNLLATKPLEWLLREGHEEGEHSLRRSLGRLHLVALGVGAVIGAGIFVLTGVAAAQFSGPAIIISMLLAGLVCALAGLCYAEFASLIPIAGSAYTYSYATLGEIFAWIIGWDLILEYAFGAATVASGWSGTLINIFQDLGITFPPRFTDTPGTVLVQFDGRWQPLTVVENAIRLTGQTVDSLPHSTAVFNLPASFAIAAITTVLIIGIKESASLNTAIVFVKLAAIITFVIVATNYVLKHPAIAAHNWTPFIPPNQGSFGKFGISGIARGAAVVFFAYIGFDAVSTAAQEAKDPERDMPFGILVSLAICTALYILVAGLLTAIVHYPELLVAAPVSVGIRRTGLQWGAWVVNGGALAGLSTVMLVMLLAQSRVFFAMSRDGLLPAWAGQIHPRFRTPWISSLIVGTFVAILAGILPISLLGQMTSIGTLLAFMIVSAAVIILRRKRPDLKRPFRTPLYPFVPVAGIVACFLLMASLPRSTWVRLVTWLVIGLVIYFTYGRYHSVVAISPEGAPKPNHPSSD